MKKLSIVLQFCLLLLFPFKFFAQTPIQGKVVDTKGNAVAFANVVLENKSDSSFIAGTITKEDGSFLIKADCSGVLHVSCMGFCDVRIATQSYNKIILHQDTVYLKEVVVSGTVSPKTVIREDALVTNVKGTYLSSMGTANDVLNRIPGITDRKGSIEVLGKGAPAIYINGRKLRNKAELEQISSGQIKDVAVIMNPGSEYEADANVKAVIKIQTAKPEGEGLGMSNETVMSVDRYVRGTEVLNLDYSSRKIDVFGMLSYDYNKDLTWNHLIQRGSPSSSYLQDNVVSVKTKQQSYDAKIGINYNLTDNQAIGVSYEHIRLPGKAWISTATTMMSDSVLDELTGIMDGKTTELHDLLNGFYNGQWGKWDMEVNVDALWYKASGDQHVTETSDVSQNRTVITDSKSHPHLYAEKMDLTHALWNGSLSLGQQFSSMQREGSYYNQEGILANSLTKIEESNNAVFAKLSQRLGKIITMAGLRCEYVDSKYYENGIKNADPSRTYFDLFPSATVVLPLGKTVMQFGYSRKIDRPLYNQLSNTVAYINRYTYESGNPYLKPMYSNEYTFNMKYNWLIVMVNYTHIQDKIISTYVPYKDDPEISLLSKGNADAIDNLQVMAVLSPSFRWYHPMLTAGIVSQFFTVDYMGQGKKLNNPIGIVRMNNTFVLSQNGIVNADFSWRSAGSTENMQVKGVWQFDIGLSKNMGKQWNLKLAGNNIFNTAHTTDAIIYSGYRQLHVYKKVYSRNIELTIRYNINVSKNKYKGKEAAKEEIERL
nr:outer membrane beta-barrel family protein [uncultured Prevotella sp.]